MKPDMNIKMRTRSSSMRTETTGWSAIFEVDPMGAQDTLKCDLYAKAKAASPAEPHESECGRSTKSWCLLEYELYRD